jgi:hypothetical protein
MKSGAVVHGYFSQIMGLTTKVKVMNITLEIPPDRIEGRHMWYQLSTSYCRCQDKKISV